MKKLRNIDFIYWTATILSGVFLTLGSAKWTIAIGPWIGYALLLYVSRQRKVWKSLFVTWLILFISGMISAYDVMPMPMPIFPIVVLVMSLKMTLPFLIDRLINTRTHAFWTTFIFPSAFVLLEYLDSFGGGGTWGSIANTQYDVQWLMQLASVTGIWGISFLIYWSASSLNWFIEQSNNKIKIRWFTFYTSLLVVVSVFGQWRIMSNTKVDPQTVKVSGITMNNSNLAEQIYADVFDQKISIPLNISQISSVLQEVNKAVPLFIENPRDDRFLETRKTMDANIDHLFKLTAESIREGARIVTWSEAIAWVLEADEFHLIERAKEFSKEHQIYLIMGLAVIHPGPMDGDHLYLTNKAITISPDGEHINTYLKSNPVPYAEQEYGSDDVIPTLSTDFGTIAPVICYDADFNHFMKQAGQKAVDILLVPSADWKAIAPYHSYMAAVRGIENGHAVVRMVSRGTSLATDAYGNELASTDFFDEGMTMTAEVPVSGIHTIYNQIGDLLVYLLMIYLGMVILWEVSIRLGINHFYENRTNQ